MALVAYGLSDDESIHSSEEEIEDEQPSGSVEIITPPKANGIVEQQLFNKLPQPRAKIGDATNIEEAEDEFLLKKEVAVEKPDKKTRIVIPALAQFDSDDDDDEGPKEKKQKLKGSGLFAVLPPPKTSPVSTTSFVPHVLKKKPATKPKPATVKKLTIKPATKAVSSDTDDDDDLKIDAEAFDVETWKQVCGRKKKNAPKKPIVSVSNATVEEAEVRIDAAPDAEEPYNGLDNEAFKKLVGSGNMKKLNMKMIDINEEEITEDKDIWMTKALTDPECKPKYVVENPVNDTCKKKHHITYLAQQAKANEQELQNQWSASRYSRKQTQMKYGF